jgi:two-component system sensor histidine kinase VicK
MPENYSAALLFALAEHDERICFAFDLTSNCFVYANPAFESFFQVPGNTATTGLLLEMVHPEDLDYLKESFTGLQPGEFKNKIEFRMCLPDKKEYALRLSLFLDKGQNSEGVLTGYLEDISGYKSQINKLHEFSNKKNAVLNILSHDLAGPLGSIQNLSQLLSRETNSLENKIVNQYLSMIEKISKKGIRLIQDFIKQEFLETAGSALLKKRINLVQPFETLIQEYIGSANEMGQFFRFDCAQPQVFAAVDEPKFVQAVNNLLSNAVKFTPDGGTITLGLEEKQESLLITVADTGIGIPAKFHAGLFDKFNDARRAGLKGEPSVGLGMSIIKIIVDWHEGKIWFDTEENKGTTFYIEIAKSS